MHLSLTLTGDFRIFTLKVNVSHPSVVFGREVIGEVIGKVFSSLSPVEAELALIYAAAHPLEENVKSFVALPAHIAGEDSVGGCAIGLDWGGRLRVAHFDEGRADGNILVAIEEYHSSFGLGGGSHDGADGMTFGEDRSIWSRSSPDVGWCWIVATV